MLFAYPAIFHKENGAYWAEFPDLEGCHAYGLTINETVACAQEAMDGYLLTLLEGNQNLISPSDMSTISFCGDSFVTLISCDVNPPQEH